MKDWIKSAFLTAGLVIILLGSLELLCSVLEYTKAFEEYEKESRYVLEYNDGYLAGLKAYRTGAEFTLKEYPVKPELEDYLGR